MPSRSPVFKLSFDGCCLSGVNSSVKIHIDGFTGQGEISFRSFIRDRGIEIREDLESLVGFHAMLEMWMDHQHLIGPETYFDSYDISGIGGSGKIFLATMKFTQDATTPGFKWTDANVGAQR